MKGHYKKRGCKCETKNCTCDKTWSVVVDLGIKKVNPKISTLRLRKYYITKLLSYFAYATLKDISQESYQNAINDLTLKGYSKSTLKGVHYTAKMLFQLAVEKRYINFDPAKNAYVQREKQEIVEMDEDELPTYFEKDELAVFLKTVKEKGLCLDLLTFYTLSYSGIRIGELIALKWRNIDFTKNTISITKTYYNPSNNTKEYSLLPPKTKKSRRTIIVDDFIMSLFKTHYKEQQQLIKHMGESYYNEHFIFTNLSKYPGYPVLIKHVENRMARLVKQVV